MGHGLKSEANLNYYVSWWVRMTCLQSWSSLGHTQGSGDVIESGVITELTKIEGGSNV